MNDSARTSELSGEFDRRVYRREFRGLLGYGDTWFRMLVRRGDLPPGRRDEGGKREWWTATEVRETLQKRALAASPVNTAPVAASERAAA